MALGLRPSATSLPLRIARNKRFPSSPRNARFNSTAPEAPPNMSWSEYLALRKGRLLWQRVATVPGALIGLFGGASYFASLEMDPAKPIMGLDPFMFYGGCTAGCMALGGVLGPSMGSALWRLKSRSVVRSFDARDANFFRRIEKYRADASLASNSTTGQMPDYYGEKIGSLHQYRTWLRDQGKFKRRHEYD